MCLIWARSSALDLPLQPVFMFCMRVEALKTHVAPEMQLASRPPARCYARGNATQRTPSVLRASYVARVPHATFIRSPCSQVTAFRGRPTQRRRFSFVKAQKVKTSPPRWPRFGRVTTGVACAPYRSVSNLVLLVP